MSDQTTNDEIVWLEAIQSKLEKALLDEGYKREQAEELTFYIAKVLSDAVALLHILENNEKQSVDEIMDGIHMFFSNLGALEEGYKLLMYKAN